MRRDNDEPEWAKREWWWKVVWGGGIFPDPPLYLNHKTSHLPSLRCGEVVGVQGLGVEGRRKGEGVAGVVYQGLCVKKGCLSGSEYHRSHLALIPTVVLNIG